MSARKFEMIIDDDRNHVVKLPRTDNITELVELAISTESRD